MGNKAIFDEIRVKLLYKKISKLEKKDKTLSKSVSLAIKNLEKAKEKDDDIEACSFLGTFLTSSIAITYLASYLPDYFWGHCVAYGGMVGSMGIAWIVSSKIGAREDYKRMVIDKASANVEKTTQAKTKNLHKIEQIQERLEDYQKKG